MAKCREYGRYLGKRYKQFTNIVWTLGGGRPRDQGFDFGGGGAPTP